MAKKRNSLSEEDRAYLVEELFKNSDFVALRPEDKAEPEAFVFRRNVNRYMERHFNDKQGMGALFIKDQTDIRTAQEAFPASWHDGDALSQWLEDDAKGDIPMKSWLGTSLECPYMPTELRQYIRKFSGGKGNNANTARWAHGVDVVGIFIELTDCYQCTNTLAYEFIAANLPTGAAETSKTTVQKYIKRYYQRLNI